MDKVKFTFVVVLTAVILPATAQSATVTYHFNGTDGISTSLWWDQGGWGSVNQNTGAEPGVVKLSKPTVDWYFPAALFKPVLPGDLAGATINSATLTLRETWGSATTPTCLYNNVEIHRVATTVAWAAGSGLATDRWGASDTGPGKYFADFNPATTSGTTWDGATHSMYDVRSSAWSFDALAMESGVLAVANAVGQGQSSDWDLKSWVEGVANGTYTNNGFALWGGNMQLVVATDNTLELRSTYSNTGLVIDYTPVPEPTAISLLGLALLPLLRRRSR